MKKFIIVALAFFLSALPSAQATLLQVDFSGQLVSNLLDTNQPAMGAFSGTMLLDSSVIDTRPEADSARYAGAVISASILLDGVSCQAAENQGLFNDVFVINNSVTFDDLFSIAVDVINADGTLLTFAIQLQDSSLGALSNDLFPEVLSLFEFDEFEISNSNSTAGIFIGSGGSTFEPVWGSLDSFEMRPVPVPAAAWLLISAIAFLGAALKKQS